MIKILLVTFFLSNISLSNELIYSAKNSKKDQSQKELLKYLNDVPKLASIVDPRNEISVAENCLSGIQVKSERSLEDIDLSGFNGCLGYKMMEELVNKSSEATQTRNDLKKQLNFNFLDSMVKFLKKGEYEKAYNYLQIYYDEDVLHKTDSEGNSVFHILAEKCNDPRAQDFLMMITIPSEYYKSKFFTPLKIKTTSKEQAQINEKCSELTIDQVTDKFMDYNFIMMRNNKGNTVLDIAEAQCKDTPMSETLASMYEKNADKIIGDKNFSLKRLQFLFPEKFREKLPYVLSKLPPGRAEEIVDQVDFANFDFIDYNNNYVFSSIAPGSVLSKKLYEKFKAEVIRSAEQNGTSLERIIQYTSNDPELLILKNSQGKSTLDLIRDGNPKLFDMATITLSSKAITDLKEGNVTPIFWEYLRNGYLNPIDSEDYQLFKLVKKIPNEDIRQKIYNEFKLKYDDNSSGVLDLNKFISKTNEDVSEEVFTKASQETCELLKTYQEDILCEKFVENQKIRRSALGVAGSLEITLINLIDQATLTQQNTAAYLLVNQLNKINPELATYFLDKMKIPNSTLDETSYRAFKPVLFEKISNGILDCSPNRYIFDEFISKNFSFALKENLTSKANPCAKSELSSTEQLRFIGITAEKNIVLSAETFKEAIKREAEPYKDSVIRVHELSRKGEYGAALGEAYMLVRNSIPSLKMIANSAATHSYITNQKIDDCKGLCNSLFVYYSTANFIELPVTIKKNAAYGAILAFVAAAYFPGVNAVSATSGAVIGATVGLFNFTLDELGDVIDFVDCQNNCEINDKMRRQDEFAKMIKERRSIFNQMKAQENIIISVLEQYQQVLAKASMYPDDDDVKRFLANYKSTFSALLIDAATMNKNFERIAKLKVENISEMEKLGKTLLDERVISLNRLQGFTEQSKLQIDNINKRITQDNRQPIGDPTGVGGHGQRNTNNSSNSNTSNGPNSGTNNSSSSPNSTTSSPSSGIQYSFPAGWNKPRK